MKTMTVVKDESGNIINIGSWNVNEAGKPAPEGSYEDTADIVEGWDGGLYASDDPRRLHPNERGNA